MRRPIEQPAETYPVSVSSALDTALSHAKSTFYPESSQVEMLQDLIRRGLQAARNAEQHPASS